MNKILVLPFKVFFVLILLSFNSYIAYGEETDVILQKLEVLQEDIKTLEKAVYSEDVKTTNSNEGISFEGNPFEGTRV